MFELNNIYAKYIYPSTNYNIQFESDNIGEIKYIYLGGTYIWDKPITKGINKFIITTSDTIDTTWIGIDGIGFNASNIVVTPAIEQDFDYFSGLSNTFEDGLVTQEMVDSGEEEESNLGKYRVDYKTVGKNKYNQIKTPFNPDFMLLEGATITKNGDNIVLNGTLTKLFDYRPTWLDELYDYVNSCQEGTILTLSNNLNGVNYWMYTENGSVDFKQNSLTIRSSMSNISCFVRFDEGTTFNESILNVQLEEGDTATAYEPYKEHTKTLYLNSPLLEGDTIEEKDGEIYHVHRYAKVVLDGSESNWNQPAWSKLDIWLTYNPGGYAYEIQLTDKIAVENLNTAICDRFGSRLIKNSSEVKPGEVVMLSKYLCIALKNITTVSDFKTFLQANPTTVVYKLKTPTYELIEQSNLAIPSYTSGHLDLPSAVPVSKVNFLHFEEELTYLYPATSYTIQFVSDKAISIDIALGGTSLLAQSIVAGLNRISITTPATLVDNKLIIDGVGAKISEVVVTDTDREFKYFEGMKSVGECEGNIEILSHNGNLYKRLENSYYKTYG